MKKNIIKVVSATVLLACVGGVSFAKTLKAEKVDLKAVSKIIDSDFKPKIEKDGTKIAIKSNGSSFVKLNDTNKILSVSSRWQLKEGVTAVDAAVLANKINSEFNLVQASFRDATRDESECFVLEAAISYAGVLDSNNLNYTIKQYTEAAAKLESLLK
ncbi:MAG: hypothetical protein IKO57_09235 [Treponema sp.]|nr:hypothetical protein [Treponema sp.]